MVSYTATVEALGEDAALPFTCRLHAILTQAVKEQGGSVRSFAGDSIMAVFGLPAAPEDPALRACRAAIAIHAAMDQAAAALRAEFGLRPVMRVGISSGLAIMAPVQGEDSALSAVGTVVNLASRVQGLAAGGQTLICDATRRQVEWQTDLSFDGEHAIKGVGRPQKLWRLRAVRPGATRFDASVARGLSPLVGRDAELSALLSALERSRLSRQAVDLVGEPGLGKTRLTFEFTQRAAASGAMVMTGHCAADGRNTPLLPFLRVVRDAFRLRDEDEPAEIAEKLEAGLQASGLWSPLHLGLMLNLLGLKAPEGALAGLDGVLIGLRTRDLLPQLLRAQTRHHPVVLLIEDAHWIDGMSQDLLTRLVRAPDEPNLMVATTHRPEYALPYADLPGLTTLSLRPLESAEVQSLVQSRLGVADLPERLVTQVTRRAGGNPLFGEEILSLLMQQGALQVEGGEARFDAALGETAVPVGVQNLLTARIDGLPPEDRALLQVAAVIGPRFDPGLLASVMPGDTGAALHRLQDLDLVKREADSADHAFRHVLLRDTVYEGLLADRRQALHLAVAEALERRSDNRLPEVAETLAYHFTKANRSRQAFAYTAMAGSKALGIYSLDLADQFFAQAMALYDSDPTCATDEAFIAFVADYGLCLNISMRVRTMLALAERIGPTLRRIGDSPHHVHFLHHLVVCLICSARYVRADEVRTEMMAMADRLGDASARAYALVTDLALSCHFQPYPAEVFEAKRQQAEAALSRLDDAYLQNYLYAYLGFDKVCRGVVTEANALAEQMIARGTARQDVRSLGYGTAMKALIALCTDDYPTALEKSEEALTLARVEWERAIAQASRNASLIALGVPGAAEEVQRYMSESERNDWTMMSSGPEAMMGIARLMQGDITGGIAHIRKTVARRMAEGNRTGASWARMYLCEVYLQILSGGGKVPLRVVLRNLGTLLRVTFFGERELREMVREVRANPHFAADGHYVARGEMLLGLLAKAKKRDAQAIAHLSEALRIINPAGQSAMRSRIETALKELGAPVA